MFSCNVFEEQWENSSLFLKIRLSTLSLGKIYDFSTTFSNPTDSHKGVQMTHSVSRNKFHISAKTSNDEFVFFSSISPPAVI